MRKVVLGKTNLNVTKVSFGALPLQRTSKEDAVKILHHAYNSGINFYDTARSYTDSEQKIGLALSDVRDKIIIATKTHSKNLEEMKRHVDESLKMLKTDYIDLYQFHNSKVVPLQDDDMYKFMLQLKDSGVVKHIGITNHSYDNIVQAIESNLYSTIQFPIFCLSGEKDLSLVDMCKKHNIGVIAMKGMGGGLVDDASLAFTFYENYKTVVPIWGVQTIAELNDFIELDKNPPKYSNEIYKKIDNYRKELGGEFCHSCGYCHSACPQGIFIRNCARMSLLCGRAVWQDYVTEYWQKEMAKIETCTNCRACVEKCPYNLDIPNLLKKNLAQYKEFIKDKV